MEARLCKVRIVGLRYDGATIHFGNKDFDFTVPYNVYRTPRHALYTLRNGGGKGVFLHCLFQPLDPLTTWNDDEKAVGNTVNHFFYNAEGNPIDYTFHVVEEWMVSSTRKMMIGISICPTINQREKSESPIDLKYLLFSKIYPATEDFDITDLPLWNEVDQEGLPLDEWKKHLNQNPDIQTYTMYDKNLYLSLLEENGLNRHAISTYKKINASEGNISHFFQDATDNLGLFYAKIIPAINDKIEGIDSRNKGEYSSLTRTFLETLKVAKELPELLAMFQSVEEFNDYLKPLMDILESLKIVNGQADSLEQEGVHIATLLNQIQDLKQKAISDKETELTDNDKNFEKYTWSKENLDYIELHKELDEMNQAYETLETKQKHNDLELRNKKEALIEAQVNMLLKKLSLASDEAGRIEATLSELENDKDFVDIQNEIQGITDYFVEKWPDIKREWQQKITMYYRIDQSYLKAITTTNQTITEATNTHRDIDFSIRELKRKIDEFQDEEKSMVAKYGEDVRLFLDEVIEKEQIKEQTLTASLVKQDLALKQHNTDLNTKHGLRGSLQTQLKRLEADERETKTQFEAKKADEESLLPLLSTQLKKHFEEIPTRSEYLDIKQDVITLLDQQEHQLLQYEKRLVKAEENMVLIGEGRGDGNGAFFIPNLELVKVKKALEEKGIEAVYGAEYLRSFNYQRRTQLIAQQPSLMYSLVVLNPNFENLNFSLFEEELLKKHVTLVDGLHLGSTQPYKTENAFLLRLNEVTYIPKNKAMDLVLDEHALSSYALEVEQDYDDLHFQMDDLKRIIKKTKEIISQLETLLGGKIAKEIETTLFNFKAEKEKTYVELDNHLKTIEELVALINTTQKEIETLTHAQKKSVETLRILKEWKKKTLLIEHVNFDLHIKEEEFKEIEEQLERLTTELTQLTTRHTSIQQAYRDWHGHVSSNHLLLLNMVKDARIPSPDKETSFDEHDYLIKKTFGSSLDKEKLAKLHRYSDLQANLGSHSSDIGMYRSDLKKLLADKIDLENQLNRLPVEDWRDWGVPDETVMVLESQVELLNKDITGLKAALERLLGFMEANTKEVEKRAKKVADKKAWLEDSFKEYGAVLSDITNTSLERDRLQSLITACKKRRGKLTEDIAGLRKHLSGIEKLSYALTALKITPNPNVRVYSEDEVVKLQADPHTFYRNWVGRIEDIKRKTTAIENQLVERISIIKQALERNQKVPVNFKEALFHLMNEIKNNACDYALEVMANYFIWAENALQSEKEQKEKAEQSVVLWVGRATNRVIELIVGLTDMEKKMKVKNWKGVNFPLVQFIHEEAFRLSKDDIEYRGKEYCRAKIELFTKKYPDVTQLSLAQIDKEVNVSNLLLHVLGHLPTLKVYIPSIDGRLLRGEPKPHYYKDWESINNGSETSPTKSGGQTLLARFIVMAMLLRQRAANDDSWLFLVSDNPIGTMSAQELIEATFSLLEILKIQWLVVAPPITNAYISSQFPTVFHMDLKIKDGKKLLTKKITQRQRKFLEEYSILDNEQQH
jgi:hypothetical protein